MPLVVPSQVVAIIDEFYDWAKDGPGNGKGGDLPPSHASRLRAILSLVDQIPLELLASISPGDYGALMIAKADVQEVIEKNLARGGNQYFPWTVPVNIRQVLAKCADEFPPSSSSDLAFIADVDLRSSIRMDVGAADRAFGNVEWKASTVLAGSAIEALLLWAITAGPKADVSKASAGIVAVRNRAPKLDPNTWDLADYAVGAAAISAISPETLKAIDLAREYRNLIHPGRAIRLAQVCDRGTAHMALGALYRVIRDLT